MTIEPYHDEPVTEALLDIEASSPERPPPAAIVVDERPSNEENRLPRVWRRRSSIALSPPDMNLRLLINTEQRHD